ncbi:MAG: DUF3782 domain-containing protein [Spirochaetota bacterium]
MTISEVIQEFPQEFQTPIRHMYDLLKDELGVTREDFQELKAIVTRIAEAQENLAEAQQRTEQRVEELAQAQQRTEQRVGELAQAQQRTEQRVGELAQAQQSLAEAQQRTEQRVEELAHAQQRTEQRVGELAQAQQSLAEAQQRTEQRVGELAQAQQRTEQRVGELAQAQQRTEQQVGQLAQAQIRLEETMQRGFKELRDSISALGSRWGLQSEETFRNAIRGLLQETGYSVMRGCYGNREVDVVIKDGEHILLEITSSMKKSDIRKYNESADDYRNKTGKEPKVMVAAIYIPPTVMRELADSPREIHLFSIEDDE